MIRLFCTFFGLLFLFSLFPTIPHALTCPQFHCNPQHTGRIQSRCRCTTPRIKWTFPTGAAVMSSPIFDENAVYFASYDSLIYCIDRETGNFIWSFPTGGRVKRAGALTQDSTVVFAGEDSWVYGLHKETGSLLWSYETVSPCWGAVTWDPATDNVYLTSYYDGSWHGWLYAFHSDGTFLWRKDPPGSGTWMVISPALDDFGNLITSDFHNLNANLTAYDSASGSIEWNINPVCSGENDIHSSPCIDTLRNRIYYGEASSSAERRIRAIDYTATSASEAWGYIVPEKIFSSPALGADGTVYIGSNDDSLYAMNPDGTVRWTFPTGGDIQSSPLVDSTGAIYFGSNDGNLYCIDSTGFELWRIALGGAVISSPTMDENGIIYVGCNNGNLYAIGCSPPEPVIVSPSPGIITSCDSMPIVLNIYDDSGDFDPTSVEITIDDTLHYSFADGMSFETVVLTFPPQVLWIDGQLVDVCLTACMDTGGTSADSLPLCWDFTVDLSPPVFIDPIPEPEEIIVVRSPLISIEVFDSIAGLNEDSLIMTIDGDTIPSVFAANVLSFDCGGTYSFTGGDSVIICVHASDMAEICNSNAADTCWNFYIAAEGPVISPIQPPQNTVSTCDDQYAIFIFDDSEGIDTATVWATINSDTVDPIWLTFDGETLLVESPSGNFADGETITVCVGGSDNLGNVQDTISCITFIIDLTPPIFSDINPVCGDTITSYYPAFSVDIIDIIAGIDEESLWMTMNGDTVISSFDGFSLTWLSDTAFLPNQWVEICLGAADSPDFCAPHVMDTCCSFYIIQRPDIMLYDIILDPPSPSYEGIEVTFCGRIFNDLFQDVSDFDIAVIINGLTDGIIPIDTLVRGDSDSLGWTVDLPQGTHELCFLVDYDDVILESNEENNMECIELVITDMGCARMPNPFTPNGDGINDFAQFTYPNIYTKESKIYIFDLWGVEVKRLLVLPEEDAKIHSRWYGRDINDNPLPQGLYIYVIEVDGEVICEGTVTIAR